MKRLSLAFSSLFLIGVTQLFPRVALASTLIFNSEHDFNGQQGYKGWQYGYYDQNRNFIQAQEGPWGEFTRHGLSLTGIDTPKQLVLRWQSNVTGSSEVKLKSLSTVSNGIQQNVLLNGESLLTELSVEDGKKSYELNTFDVESGSILDFVFDTNKSDIASRFLFNSAIRVRSNASESNPIALDPIQIESSKYKLVFYNDFDHIALYANDYLYEAHPEHGVRKFAAPELFAADTRNIELPESLGAAMVEKIKSKINRGYFDRINAHFVEQKGYNNNNSFTNIGLIEWAAEEVGYRGSQGFINNYLESQHSGIEFLFNNVKPEFIPEPGYKLVFYKAPNFNHIALYANGYLYEAHPEHGVRKSTAPESFAADTRTIELSDNIGSSMVEHIISKIDCEYLNKANANPAEQKGYNNSFTNIGLIEWAAEKAGYRGSQGFINNHLEYQDIVCLFAFNCSNNWKFTIRNIYHSFVTESLKLLSVSYSFEEYVKFEAAKSQNLLIGTDSYEDVLIYRNSLNLDREIEDFFHKIGENSFLDFDFESPFDIPSSDSPFSISPELLEPASIDSYFKKSPKFFQADFDSQYFTITDPLGRRIGYTPKGFFNEIEDVFYQSVNTHSLIQTLGAIAPITVANGNTFTIPHGTSLDHSDSNQGYTPLIPSENTKFTIYFSNPKNGEYQISYLTDSTGIPEPTSWISLLTSLLLGGWLYKHQKVK